jgi:pimeloyl-ACP methyl ester carboxylesterase
MHQQIQYTKSADGVQLAYATIGKGSPIVRTGNWLTHLDYDLKSPVWRHVFLGLAQRHRLIRFDARGTGLSQRDVAEISFDRWVDDIEAIVKAASLDRFVLLGISQGAATAIAYAVRHPERVSHLILYGGYARGSLYRGDPEKARENAALIRSIIREGWGSEDESYRNFFTSQFIPDGTPEQFRWFNELERVSATPESAERYIAEVSKTNIADLLPQVSTPTLVLHCKGDRRVPFAMGQELAAEIPGAKFVPLEGKNHLFLANEPAHRAFFDAVTDFLGEPPLSGPLPGTGSVRDRLDRLVRDIEQSWIIKVVIIIAAITGVVIFFLEMWKLLQH